MPVWFAAVAAVFFALASLVVADGAAREPRPTAPAVFPDASGRPMNPPGDWRRDVLYFILVDRFADGFGDENDRFVRADRPGYFHGGDLVGLRRRLDELADLGITAIWINPVVKNIPRYVGGELPHWGYHGYWADDFYALDPRFGTEADLRELADAAHARGIKILLDVVYNHPGYESRYVREKPEWLRLGDECGGDDPITMCLSGLPDFRTELPEVADYLMKAHLGLAERAGLDGFRLDTVKHVRHEFWREHRRRAREQLGGDFFLLGEVWGGNAEVLDEWFEGDELDAGFDFSFRGSALGFVSGRGRAIAFSRYLQRRDRQLREGYDLVHYLSSHDEPGALYELEGDKRRFKLLAALQMATRGIPMIFYGEEVGRSIGKDWTENRTDMPWGGRPIMPGGGVPRDEDMRGYYRKLIAARRALPELALGEYVELSAEGDAVVFARKGRDSAAVVAVNRSESEPAARDADVSALPGAWKTAKSARDIVGGGRAVREGNFLKLEIPPMSAMYLVPEDE